MRKIQDGWTVTVLWAVSDTENLKNWHVSCYYEALCPKAKSYICYGNEIAPGHLDNYGR